MVIELSCLTHAVVLAGGGVLFCSSNRSSKSGHETARDIGGGDSCSRLNWRKEFRISAFTNSALIFIVFGMKRVRKNSCTMQCSRQTTPLASSGSFASGIGVGKSPGFEGANGEA